MKNKTSSNLIDLKAQFLTTGQVAAHCGVNFRTVIRWIKKGYLPAQRLPGRGDHRISRDDFLTFLNKNNLQVPTHLQTPTSLNELQPAAAPKVLIVEDDPALAHSIQRVLKTAGYLTQIAHNGFEAGLLIESYKPALMTLDLLMSGIDGINVLSALQANHKLSQIKVLIISADTDQRVNQALSLGAHAALKKPFQNQELLSQVLTLIGRSPHAAASN